MVSGDAEPTQTLSSPPVPPSVPGSTAAASPTAVRRPNRRRSRSVWLTIGSWIVGGAIGCIGAVLLLAFGFGKDPFGLFGERAEIARPSEDSDATRATDAAPLSLDPLDRNAPDSPQNPEASVPSPAPPIIAEAIPAQPTDAAGDPAPPTSTATVRDSTPHPIPSPEEIGAARERMDESLSKIFAAAASPDRRVPLAFQLLTEAERSGEDPALRYFLLRTASDFAVMGGSFEAARRADAEIKRLYAVDPFVVDAASLERFASSFVSEGDLRQVVLDAVELASELSIANRFAEADRALHTAETCAGRVSDVGVRRIAGMARMDFVERRSAWNDFQNAKSKLSHLPDDGPANLQVGRYLCLFQNDWNSGLANLAKGDDSAIREAAARDLANPSAPAGMVAVADDWYAIAKAEKGDPRYLDRARYWYAHALPGLDRVGRVKPSSRLSEAAPIRRNVASFANTLGMTMQRIPAGEFRMGAEPGDVEEPFPDEPDVASWIGREGPRHPVRISRSFYMATHETTVDQFETFVRESKFRTHAETLDDRAPASSAPKKSRKTWKDPGIASSGDHPVVYVTWTDACAFTEWLSKREGLRYRLPTEAEWEYACRAGSDGLYSFGDDPKDLGWFANCADASLLAKNPNRPTPTLAASDGFAETAPVGSFPPNGFGLHDMHGNVWEWCVDRVEENYYARSPFYDPVAASRGAGRAYRGGGWDTRPFSCRSGSRGETLDTTEHVYIGFRVVCEGPDVAGGPPPTFAEFAREAEPRAETPPSTPLADIRPREALPPPEKIAAAQTRLNEIYAKEFAEAKSAEDRIGLAASLMSKADDLTDDFAARFAVLRTARNLAIAAGDQKTSGEATDLLVKSFDVDPLEARVHLLTELAETAKTDPARRDLADDALAEAERAVAARRFHESDLLIAIARGLGTKIRNESYRSKTDVFERRSDAARKAFDAYQAAKTKLDASPDDVEALEACGRYLCLEEDDWSEGLPYLAKSPEPLLKGAAESDIADPTDAKSRLAAADAWFAYSEANDANEPFALRARHWYAQALDDLTGLDKLHAEKRVADIDRRFAVRRKTTDVAETKAPPPIDAWDKEYVRSVSGSSLFATYDYISIFGGSSRANPENPYLAKFVPCKGGEVQHVQWELHRPMTVGRVRVRLRHEPGDDVDGAAKAIRFYGFDPLNRTFELLFEYRPAFPYGDSKTVPSILPKRLSKPEELDFTARFDPVTTSGFRAEFVMSGESDETVDGVQIVELDAYAE